MSAPFLELCIKFSFRKRNRLEGLGKMHLREENFSWEIGEVHVNLSVN
jgi:hypothetical protein